MAKPEDLVCSFCSADYRERALIAGPSVYICEDCVGLCVDVLCKKHEAGEIQKIDPVIKRAALDRRTREVGESALRQLEHFETMIRLVADSVAESSARWLADLEKARTSGGES